MTSARSANTTDEKNAERVRNSIARSLRAISQALKRMSATGCQCLAINADVGCRVDALRDVLADEFSRLHHRRPRRQRESFRQIVGDDDDRRAGGAELLEKRCQRPRAAVVEPAV